MSTAQVLVDTLLSRKPWWVVPSNFAGILLINYYYRARNCCRRFKTRFFKSESAVRTVLNLRNIMLGCSCKSEKQAQQEEMGRGKPTNMSKATRTSHGLEENKTWRIATTSLSTMSRETRRRHETVEASQQRAERLLRLEVLRNQSNKDLNGSKTKQGLKTISQQRKIQLLGTLR